MTDICGTCWHSIRIGFKETSEESFKAAVGILNQLLKISFETSCVWLELDPYRLFQVRGETNGFSVEFRIFYEKAEQASELLIEGEIVVCLSYFHFPLERR